MSYVSGLGDATSTATACATYAADLAKWQSEQKAYMAAMSARAASMASADAAYKAALKTYYAELSGQSAAYAQATAQVLAKYKATLPKGYPGCVPKATHNLAVTNCDLIRNPLRGLGAYDWTAIQACLLSELPVCKFAPLMPAKPAAPPMPTLRAKPVAPTGCSATATTTTAVKVATPTTPLAPIAPSASQPSAPTDFVRPIEEASMTQTKSGAGLIVVAVLGAAAVGYLFFRKKKA